MVADIIVSPFFISLAPEFTHYQSDLIRLLLPVNNQELMLDFGPPAIASWPWPQGQSVLTHRKTPMRGCRDEDADKDCANEKGRYVCNSLNFSDRVGVSA
jgi:hypothetical protein